KKSRPPLAPGKSHRWNFRVPAEITAMRSAKFRRLARATLAGMQDRTVATGFVGETAFSKNDPVVLTEICPRANSRHRRETAGKRGKQDDHKATHRVTFSRKSS